MTESHLISDVGVVIGWRLSSIADFVWSSIGGVFRGVGLKGRSASGSVLRVWSRSRAGDWAGDLPGCMGVWTKPKRQTLRVGVRPGDGEKGI